MKEIILIGILTSLLITIVLYVLTIQHYDQNNLTTLNIIRIKNNNNSHQQLRGVVINEKKFNYFQCIDGSSKIAIENDEYCDCLDGSDETKTSACSYILIKQKLFKCKEGTLTIYPSRVNDGVCDCPDGSDEYGSNIHCRKHVEINKLYSSF